MSKGNPSIIGVRTEPEGDGFDNAIEWHITNVTGNDYATACALDADDPFGAGTYGVVAPPAGTKITCAQCFALWQGFRSLRLREVNFSPEAQR